MPTLFPWLASSFLILACSCLMPGISVWHPLMALEVAMLFGALNASLRPFFRYADIPVTPFTIGLFSLLANGGFIFWTSAIQPGFMVRGWTDAVIFVVLLSAGNTYLALYPRRVYVRALDNMPERDILCSGSVG